MDGDKHVTTFKDVVARLHRYSAAEKSCGAHILPRPAEEVDRAKPMVGQGCPAVWP